MAESVEADPLIGRTIGRKFRVDRLLGAGAMGRVYLAEQTNLGKQVALKVLHAAMAGDAQLAKRFYREAKSASMLSHPNILQIIDFGDDEGLLFIAMELLTGRDLYRVQQEEFPFSLERIGHIGGQILGALDEAHAKGVVHRDLKPENVMLLDVRGESDFVKVCDFGIAKVASERDGEGSAITMAGMVCGTPEYMSPEQARGDALDGRSDLYAMAVMLYQMIAGDVPFRAESALGVITKHLTEEPRPPSARRSPGTVPPALEAVILRGLRKDKAERFASAAEMRAALLEAVGMRRPSPSSPSQPRTTMPADVAMASTGVATPQATPAAPTLPSAPSSGSVHGELAARPAGSRRAGLVVGGLALVVAAGVAVMVLVGNARPPGPVAATGGPAAASPAAPPSTAPPSTAPSSTAPSGAVPPSTAPSSTAPPSTAPPSTAPSGAAPSLPTPGAGAPAPVPQPTVAATPAPAAPAPPAAQPAAAPAPAHHRRERPRPTTHAAVAAPRPSAPAAPPPTPKPPAAAPKSPFAEGEALFRAGDVQSALAKYLEAARQNPSDARTQRQIGKCYNRLGQRDKALPYLQRYLQLAPNASDAAFIRAILEPGK